MFMVLMNYSFYMYFCFNGIERFVSDITSI